MWVKRGRNWPVMLSGYNARRVIFGSINLSTGHRLLLERPRQRAEDFQEFLDLLRWHYRSWSILLLLDEDGSHRAGESQELADDLGIELLWLPKRAPELNGMDQLWRRAKQTVSANHQYDSIQDHVTRFTSYVLGLSPTDALRQAGILSQDFWLRKCLAHLW